MFQKSAITAAVSCFRFSSSIRGELSPTVYDQKRFDYPDVALLLDQVADRTRRLLELRRLEPHQCVVPRGLEYTPSAARGIRSLPVPLAFSLRP